MLEVRKSIPGWLQWDTKDGDIVYAKVEEIGWVVDKKEINKRWIVLKRDDRLYWEVDTRAIYILEMME